MRPSPQAPAVPGSSRLPELEGLRGLLALWVATAHLFCWVGWDDLFEGGLRGHLWAAFAHAQSAVGLFIVLSGFAIWRLLERDDGQWCRFMTGRFWRIYPVYLVGLAVAGVAAWVQPSVQAALPWGNEPYFQVLSANSASERAHPFAHVAAHLTLLHGLLPRQVLPGSSGSILAPAWSLSLEWQFYLLAPFIWIGRRQILTWLLVAAVAILGERWSAPMANPQMAFLPPLLPLFLLGIASAWAQDRWNSGTRTSRAWVVGGALCLVATAWLLRRNAAIVTAWVAVFGLAAGWWGRSAVMSMGRRVFLWSPIQALGHMSYPLYLIHWPLTILAIGALTRLRPSWTSGGLVTVLFVAVLPLILLAAWTLHRWIEKPAMQRARPGVSSLKVQA